MARCLILFLLLAPPLAFAGDRKAEPLTILNAAGKQEKLRTWKFTVGTRPLSWLDTPGPECLQFRDEHSTGYQDGILTLIPLANLKAIDYDADKKTVAVTALAASGKEETLLGTTKYTGINRLALVGEADLGDLGAAEVKLQGGVPMGLRGLRFPAPRPAPEMKGRPATIVAEDKEKTAHPVTGLTALYSIGTTYRTLPVLMFKKTVKIDFDKLAGLRHLPPADKKQTTLDFEVTLAEGARHNLALLRKVELDGSQPAQLVGLVGQVPVGYKLFPPHTIAELRLEPRKDD